MLNLLYWSQKNDPIVNIFNRYVLYIIPKTCSHNFSGFPINGKSIILHVEPKNMQTLVGYRVKGLLSIYGQFSL